MSKLRPISLKIDEREWKTLRMAVDRLEQSYRCANLALKRGGKSSFTSSPETARDGIKRCYNLNQRIMAAAIRARKSRVAGVRRLRARL
jgi:hypothetical protein